MIRYTTKGTDAKFDKMIWWLGKYPQKLDRAISGGMKKTVDFTYKFVKPRIPRKSGASRAALEKEILGYGKSMTGFVGFPAYEDSPWYINVVEHGARKHSLKPRGNSGSRNQRARRSQALQKRIDKGTLKSTLFYRVKLSGGWVSVSDKVVHPGFSKRGFMAAGFSAARPIFDHEMQIAVDKLWNELDMNAVIAARNSG